MVLFSVSPRLDFYGKLSYLAWHRIVSSRIAICANPGMKIRLLEIFCFGLAHDPLDVAFDERFFVYWWC